MPLQPCVFHGCADAVGACIAVSRQAQMQTASLDHKAMALALRCHCPDAQLKPPSPSTHVTIDKVCSTHFHMLSNSKLKAGGSFTVMDYALLLQPSASRCWFTRLFRPAVLSFLDEKGPELAQVLGSAYKALMQSPPSACSMEKMISLLVDDSGGTSSTAPSAAPTAGATASKASAAGATAAALAANTQPLQLPIVVYVISPHDPCMSSCSPRAEFDSVLRMQQLGLTTAAKFSDLQAELNLLFDVPDPSSPALLTVADADREDRTILTKSANVLAMPESLVPPVFLKMNPQLQQQFSLHLVTMDAFEAAVATVLLANRCSKHREDDVNSGQPAHRLGDCCELATILDNNQQLVQHLERMVKWQKDKEGTDDPMPLLLPDTAICVLPSYLQMRFPCRLDERYRLVDLAGKIARAQEQPGMFPARILPDPDVERHMEQKHLYVGHLLEHNAVGSRFPPTRIISRCEKSHAHTALLTCADCLRRVQTTIQAVLKEAAEGGWAKAVSGIVSDQSTGAASRGLILKGIGTRGLAGITFDIPSSYLDQDGAVADSKQAEFLAQRVLSSMQLGMQGLPFARESAMLTQSQSMCVRQTHFQLQYLVAELKSAEVRQYHLNWHPVRTMTAPNFSEGQADTMELIPHHGPGLPTSITHALLDALESAGSFAQFSRGVLTDLQQWRVTPSSAGVVSTPQPLLLVSRSVTTRVDMGVSVRRFASREALNMATGQWQSAGVVWKDVTVVLDEPNTFAAARVFLVEVTTSGEINWFASSDCSVMALAHSRHLAYEILRQLRAQRVDPSQLPALLMADDAALTARAATSASAGAGGHGLSALSVTVGRGQQMAVGKPVAGVPASNMQNFSGSACYLIALLQALVCSTQLRNALRQHYQLLDGASRADCPSFVQEDRCCTICQLSLALDTLADPHRSDGAAELAAIPLGRAFDKRRAADGQQDAHEMLVHLTERITSAAHRLHERQKASPENFQHLQHLTNLNQIGALMQLTEATTRTCQTCRTAQESIDDPMVFSVTWQSPLASGAQPAPLSLQQLIKDHTIEYEYIDDVLRCEGGQRRCIGSCFHQRSTFLGVPPVLTLALVRETYGAHGEAAAALGQQQQAVRMQRITVEEVLEVPLEDLEPARYRLQAIVYMPPAEKAAREARTLNSAQHYATLRRRHPAQAESTWLNFDDTLGSVTQVDNAVEAARKCWHSARLVVYERIDTISEAEDSPPAASPVAMESSQAAAASPVAMESSQAAAAHVPAGNSPPAAASDRTDDSNDLLRNNSTSHAQSGSDSAASSASAVRPDPALSPVVVGMPMASARAAASGVLEQLRLQVASDRKSRRPRVAVVGGGIAGLAASEQLVRAGFEVHLFEPRPRVGGRIYTRNFKELAVSMGATFVYAEKGNLQVDGGGLCAACENRLVRQVIAPGAEDDTDARFVETHDFESQKDEGHTQDVVWVLVNEREQSGSKSKRDGKVKTVELAQARLANFLWLKVDELMLADAEEEQKKLEQSGLVSSEWKRPSQEGSLNKNIKLVVDEWVDKLNSKGDPAKKTSKNTKGEMKPTVLAEQKSRLMNMVRAEYVTQVGYAAAPSQLSLIDMKQCYAANELPEQGCLHMVDPGGVVSSRPHLGMQLLLQPYMQALEQHPQFFLHLRSVVHGVERQKQDSNGFVSAKIEVSRTPLSYDEDQLMRHPLSSGQPTDKHFQALVPHGEPSQSYYFDAVLCTAPVAVLAKQEPSIFSQQSISNQKQAAIGRLASLPGRELRVILSFRFELIPELTKNLRHLRYKQVPGLVRTVRFDPSKMNDSGELAAPRGDEERWRLMTYPDTSPIDPQTCLPWTNLVIAVLNPMCIDDTMMRQSQDELAEDALNWLRMLYTDERVALAQFQGALVTHWLRDPYSRAAYCAIGTQSSVADVKQLAEKDPPFFFAGDATSERGLQQVSGAARSGERAAQEIIQDAQFPFLRADFQPRSVLPMTPPSLITEDKCSNPTAHVAETAAVAPPTTPPLSQSAMTPSQLSQAATPMALTQGSEGGGDDDARDATWTPGRDAESSSQDSVDFSQEHIKLSQRGSRHSTSRASYTSAKASPQRGSLRLKQNTEYRRAMRLSQADC